MLKRDSKGRFLPKYRYRYFISFSFKHEFDLFGNKIFMGNCTIDLPSIINNMNDIDYIIEHVKKSLEKRSNTPICFITIINFKLLKDCWKENQND